VFAYIVDGSRRNCKALDITLRRFAEYHNLQGAFGRRAQTGAPREFSWAVPDRRAQAFEMLRDHARLAARNSFTSLRRARRPLLLASTAGEPPGKAPPGKTAQTVV
jgi:hypothetical protein